MNGPAVSRSWLACIAVAVACSCLPVTVRVIGQYRYAVWASVNRDMLDSLLFALPVVVLLSMVTARIWCAEGLPWLLPHQPRARSAAVRTAVAAGIAAALGLLLGWLPVLVWGLRTATYGHPSILNILGVLAWIVATAVVAIALTVMTRSIWPAIVLSLGWIAIFIIGRADVPAGTKPTTRLFMLPFDGVYGAVYTPLHQNPALCWLRLVGAALVLSLAVFVLRRVLDEGARRQKIRTGLLHWPALLVLAVSAGSTTQTVPIATTSHQPLRCTEAIARTCAYASHAPDLPVAAAIADRLHRNTNGLFSPRLISESKSPDTAVATITLYPDTTNDLAVDVAQQLRDFTLGPTGCYDTAPQHPAVTQILDRWLAARGQGRAPDTSGLTDAQAQRLRHWNKNPAATNAKLRAIWPHIHHCDLPLNDLPQ